MPTLSPNLPADADADDRVAPLRTARERFLESGQAPGHVRCPVADSWRRCRRAGVDPDRAMAPVQLTDGELGAYRDDHPLAAVLPLLRELLADIAVDSRHVMAVADADARLLWVEGHPELRRRAESMNFVEGAAWAERHAGTNAPGTAVASGRPVRVFTAEHFSHHVQPWSCAAAPIRDPHSGALLGVVDVTGGDDVGSPASLAFVRASALAAEGELRRRRPGPGCDAAAEAAEPPTAGRLEVMGRDDGLMTLGARQLRLSRRHAEIMALLAQRPDGLTAERLSGDLYGAGAKPTTLRAEMVRLRRLLPDDILDSRPYRLRIPVSVDCDEIRDLVHGGSVAEAVQRYRGPLLPHSQAPAIEEERSRVEQQVRAALIGRPDPDLLERWLDTPWGRDDAELWQLLAGTARTATTRAIAEAEVRRLGDDRPDPSENAA